MGIRLSSGNRRPQSPKIPWSPDIQPAADPAFLIAMNPYRWEFVAAPYGQIHQKFPTDGAAAVELATGKRMIDPELGARYLSSRNLIHNWT
jgi:hypothetical protein